MNKNDSIKFRVKNIRLDFYTLNDIRMYNFFQQYTIPNAL